MTDAIERVLTRWVRWINLVHTRRVACVCKSCPLCEAKQALDAEPETQRHALTRLLVSVSFDGHTLIRPCDCRQCLECQARAALAGKPIGVADRKMTAVVGSDGSVHYVLKVAQELRSAHRRGNPMRCEDCGTVNRYWTGYAWRCSECQRRERAEA